jgi:hypothetical protein
MGESGEMLFGDKQDVHRRLRVDVREGEDMVILVEALNGNGAGGDFAEEAGGQSVEGRHKSVEKT